MKVNETEIQEKIFVKEGKKNKQIESEVRQKTKIWNKRDCFKGERLYEMNEIVGKERDCVKGDGALFNWLLAQKDAAVRYLEREAAK